MKKTDETKFNEAVGRGGPCLAVMWAGWCAPCLAMRPAVEELADEFAGRVETLWVDVDDTPAVAARLDVRAIPCFVFMDKGCPVKSVVGVMRKDDMRECLAGLVA